MTLQAKGLGNYWPTMVDSAQGGGSPFFPKRAIFEFNLFHAKRLPGQVPMTPQKLVVLLTTLLAGGLGLFAPVGVVKWLLLTEPEDAGILTLFFFPVWCLLVVLGLLIGRRLGLLATGRRRVAQR
jgi:hypothetical protein